jgi:hypothetical protein
VTLVVDKRSKLPLGGAADLGAGLHLARSHLSARPRLGRSRQVQGSDRLDCLLATVSNASAMTHSTGSLRRFRRGATLVLDLGSSASHGQGVGAVAGRRPGRAGRACEELRTGPWAASQVVFHHALEAL